MLSRFAKDRTVRERKTKGKKQEKSGVLKKIIYGHVNVPSAGQRPGLLVLGCSAQTPIALTQDDLTEKSGFDGT